ncbi:IMS domain-containing protein [Nostoc sp.]|uniref:IMS domain-containing protein n=1 Tax=Nostoc sp. TaxID=1180 RepID=UPI002FFD03FF
MSITLKLGSLVNNRYQIQEVIQQSNFEIVYLAKDKLQSEEICILRKLISKEAGKAANIGREFQLEIKKLRNIVYPQIQVIKDYFCGDDKLFVVQSYIEGQNYQDLLDARSSLKEPEIIQLLNQILPALGYLHNQQAIHGDISPHNLTLRSHDNLAILTNFGVIKDIMAQMGIETTEPKLINRVRTLPIGFIPPGASEDLYAFAVTAIILLTGKDIEVLFNPQTQTWDWESWTLVSDELASILNRMLAVQPINRFVSADAVLQALNSAVAPTFVTPPVPPNLPIQPTYDSYQQPTAFYQPSSHTSYQPEVNNTYFPNSQSSSQDWQKPAIIGGVIGGCILLGLLLTRQQFSQPIQQISTAQLSPTPETTPTSNSNSAPSTLQTTAPSQPLSSSISQQDAVNFIERWQRAKKEIFAPPYNRQLGAELTTGEAYRQNVGFDSSLEWLSQNNAYYTYGVQRLGSVQNFVTNGNQATIEIEITEERTLYKNGKLDQENTSFDTRLVRYSLQLENGQLKMSDYKTVRVIKKS